MSRDGKIIPGQTYEERRGIAYPFTQQMVDVERVADMVDQDFVDIEPVDAQNCRVRQYLTTAFPNYTLQFKSGEPIPGRFGGLLSTNETTETAVGDVFVPVALGDGITGVIESSAEQSKNHEVTKRQVSRTVALPLVLNSKALTQQYGGANTIIVDTFDTLAAHGTPTGGLMVLKDEITATTALHGQRTREVSTDLSWPILFGTLVDRNTGLVSNFTKHVVDAGVTGGYAGATITSIEPIDQWRSEQTVTTIDDVVANSIFDTYPTRISVRVPDELLSLEAVANSVFGEGSHTPTGSGTATGASASLSLSLSARANSSASLSLELQPTYKYNSARGTNIPANEHYFFMPVGCTEADILSRLTTELGAAVHAWPLFDEEPLVFTITNQQASIAENAEIQQSNSIAAANTFLVYSTGSGHSVETGNTNVQKVFPPTIHGALSLSGTTTVTQALSPTASVSWPNGASNWPARSAGAALPTINVTTSVTPTIISTTRVTSVPISGLYLQHYEIQSKEIDRAVVIAIVVDMAVFA